ncbi:MAG: alpha-amylase, partial [Spirochaetales bacterium]|nr:alpha-amylase [Spirochaetales bacterium]
VPNHMGIDSHWVMEHPDWFVGLDYSPFPSYSFGGPDLSWKEGVGIHLEDHYYSRSDAAVVFKRVDHGSGRERYLYHGNDGTSMPWNDTAQLDFLNPEVREAVIQTILHVARSFPVIRFDAAMTLTRKHYQRLWYPEPGTGGDIPSRADHGLPRSEFERAMPNEFWREVVDRVAREVPDTLLLAEAFWLLEGYFVRTLGMHRVYNSAFMNMLKAERNAEYRSVIKNTLEFNPEILKRFVNFMNNPDEETAVAQFGKGDKYFGVCTMMITLPGLPMFGHGQVEGYTEKYGMEFRRAYWDERPDQDLVRRHAHQVFPLLHRRYLFAEVENFLLYDLFTPEGGVNEDVFAYSNRIGGPGWEGSAAGGQAAGSGEAALVVYHNRYADTRGWVRTSSAVSARTGRGEERALVQRSLGEGLGLSPDPGRFCLFRDAVSGLEYLRRSASLRDQGLYVELGAYQLHVFLDFREVTDSPETPYATLADYLNGRGVPSVVEALREVVLQPLRAPAKELMATERFRRLRRAGLESGRAESGTALLDQTGQHLRALLDRLWDHGGGAPGPDGERTLERTAAAIQTRLEAWLRLTGLQDSPAGTELPPRQRATLARELEALLADEPYGWATLLAWVFVHALGTAVPPAPGEVAHGIDAPDSAQRSRSWIDELLLGKLIAGTLQELGLEPGRAWRAVALLKILTVHQRWFAVGEAEPAEAYRVLERLLGDLEVQEFLQVHRHDGILWFNRESFEELLRALLAVGAIQSLTAAAERPQAREGVGECLALFAQLREAQEKSGYQVEKLLSAAASPRRRAPAGSRKGARASGGTGGQGHA